MMGNSRDRNGVAERGWERPGLCLLAFALAKWCCFLSEVPFSCPKEHHALAKLQPLQMEAPGSQALHPSCAQQGEQHSRRALARFQETHVGTALYSV